MFFINQKFLFCQIILLFITNIKTNNDEYCLSVDGQNHCTQCALSFVNNNY